jgi:hypothetical protein
MARPVGGPHLPQGGLPEWHCVLTDLSSKQGGCSGAASCARSELGMGGKLWGTVPHHLPPQKTGGNFEAQQAPWWPSGAPQAGRPPKNALAAPSRLALPARRRQHAAGITASPAGGFADGNTTEDARPQKKLGKLRNDRWRQLVAATAAAAAAGGWAKAAEEAKQGAMKGRRKLCGRRQAGSR